MDDTLKDPVCGMQVSRDSFALEHLGIHYAFCSQQCQDRFRSNPHLYIGVPGEKAPKQQGVEIIKQRRFLLEQPLTDAEAASLVAALGALMGIKRTEVSGNTVTITYDLLQATAEQIAARMGEIGLNMGADGQSACNRGLSTILKKANWTAWRSPRIRDITRPMIRRSIVAEGQRGSRVGRISAGIGLYRIKGT